MKKIWKIKTLDTWKKMVLQKIKNLCQRSMVQRGVFRIVLSGGSTPIPLYKAWPANFPWKETEIFLADERDVPLNDQHSNFYLLKRNLFNHAAVVSKKIVFFDTTLPVQDVIRNYEKHLNTSDQFFFDLILLGIGIDGHTASIFPNTKSVQENKDWVVKTKAGLSSLIDRYTLTLSALKSSRNIFFLLRGQEKKKILRKLTNIKNSLLPSQYLFNLPQSRMYFCEE